MFGLLAFVGAAAAKDCHAVPGSAASDDWCNANCNFSPPNCPVSLCRCDDGPTPTPVPTPAPVPTPTPTPSPSPTPAGNVLGYWDWTWEPSRAPSGATFGVAFNGWADPSQALSDSEDVYSSLIGDKYISIGGGNSNGRFTRSTLQALVSSINNGKFSKYDGIALDVEECDSGLESDFTQALAAAKAKGMKTMVTISHSAPYGCDDAGQLMQTFFADANTDYLSPQMYTSGEERTPDFDETTDAGVPFAEYTKSKAAIIPSIVDQTHYEAVKNFFSAKGVLCHGYVQWAHARTAPVSV